ncbi:uncharacterized protein HKW66_Vig0247640 [Vigna angularis]|uniref:Uncharacterized protein n=1 Tax=Phaseolus angularis TaxID=3914 RepID=A0A8T0KTB6_PHAAN|nr:uncharacterized protein HKW66_Vig0247640 [Vigna angularis]
MEGRAVTVAEQMEAVEVALAETKAETVYLWHETGTLRQNCEMMRQDIQTILTILKDRKIDNRGVRRDGSESSVNDNAGGSGDDGGQNGAGLRMLPRCFQSFGLIVPLVYRSVNSFPSFYRSVWSSPLSTIRSTRSQPSTVDIEHNRKPTVLLQWMGMNALVVYSLAACDIFPAAIQGFYWHSPENNLVDASEALMQAIFHSEKWGTMAIVISLIGLFLCFALPLHRSIFSPFFVSPYLPIFVGGFFSLSSPPKHIRPLPHCPNVHQGVKVCPFFKVSALRNVKVGSPNEELLGFRQKYVSDWILDNDNV